ncbi:AMP-dependent synthetase [Kyrpidia spormannii]|uniref:acetate--CoA ligase n=1 Tax=Kyrpidia spormannii TaxID=2055160 RepID=A0A2K8N6W4_9BACL|nr:AMP-binding protein [Kyrpidia spormannii]ATY84547.1 AMP-dependent synthetase [Kyrpidia spormannii]
MRAPIIWQPSDAYTNGSHLQRFMQKLNIESYDALYRFSIENTDEFWKSTLEELGIEWFEPYKVFVDLERGKPWPYWFVGGKINLTYNALRRAQDPGVRDRVILRWEGEDGTVRTLSYAEMEEQVARFAGVLQMLGVGKGDRVGLYMPMIPEAAIAHLAIARIGAISVPMFSGYGVEAVLIRLKDAGVKLIVTADGFYRRGRVVSMKEVVDKAAEGYGSLESIVVVRRLGVEVSWREGRDWAWDELLKTAEPVTIQPMDANDPFLIIYTSGTTGKPKGTVHYHGGLPLKATLDTAQFFDLREGETLFWLTDMGWLVGPMIVSAALTLGATLVMYEGAPDYPGWHRLARIIEHHQVTHLGVSPTLVRALMQHDEALSGDLSSLRMLLSTGEVWDSESYLWFFNEFGGGKLPIINFSGGTEISGGILGNVIYRPIKVGGFNSVALGIKAAICDEMGRPVCNQTGELSVLEPFVGMTQGFWKEPDRYLETYWGRFNDIWVHGDLAFQDDDGQFFILGRSDDTLKIAGKRLGPAEVEDLVTTLPHVTEAVAVGIPHPQKGEQLLVFVVPRGEENPEELSVAVSRLVEERLGKSFRPERVILVSQLPKTRTGKLMRRVVRQLYMGEVTGDLSSLDNPQAITAIKAAIDGQHG